MEGRAGLSTFSSKLALSIVDAILKRDLQTSKLNLRCYLQHYMARWNRDTCVSSPDLNSRICIKRAARTTINKCSIRYTTSKAERLESLGLFGNVAPHIFLVVTELHEVAALLGKCCVSIWFREKYRFLAVMRPRTGVCMLGIRERSTL